MSQALHAGGFATYPLWKPYTADWISVVSLCSQFRFNKWLTVGSQYSGNALAAAYTSANRGDIFMYDWGKGNIGFSHMAMEVGWGARATAGDGTGDYMDQHTTDRYHAPWNYGYRHPDSKIDRAHMRVWVLHV